MTKSYHPRHWEAEVTKELSLLPAIEDLHSATNTKVRFLWGVLLAAMIAAAVQRISGWI